jgi:hypothetical protein
MDNEALMNLVNQDIMQEQLAYTAQNTSKPPLLPGTNKRRQPQQGASNLPAAFHHTSEEIE